MKHLLRSLIGLLLVTGCQPVTQDTRADTRASISGRVVLTDIPGLSDMSRVRVEFGKGEGGTTPDEDGLFQSTDLEPDVYELRVLYIGGLTSDATESAYQEFNRRILLQQGGHVDLGDIALELGLGTVTGQLVLTDDTSTDGAVAKLSNATLMREAPVIEGTYTFEDVPIGTYSLLVEKEGYTLSQSSAMSSSAAGDEDEEGEGGEGEAADADMGCTQNTVVGFHSETVSAADFRFTPTNVSILPGMGEEVQMTRGSQWVLDNAATTVTANVVGGFITHARMWFDVNAPGAWEPFASGQGFEIDVAELSEGNNTVYFQFGGCRYESPVTTLDILRDKTAPVLENLELRGYAADADGTYWVSTNAATLTVDLLANDEHSAVAGVAVIHPDDNTAPALSSLVFDDISAGDGLILDSRQVGLSAGDGAKRFTFISRIWPVTSPRLILAS